MRVLSDGNFIAILFFILFILLYNILALQKPIIKEETFAENYLMRKNSDFFGIDFLIIFISINFMETIFRGVTIGCECALFKLILLI